MSTPRVTVSETLAADRITVTDTAPRITVTESGTVSGIAVTATGTNIAVTLSQTAAGVSSINGVTGAVTLTTTGVPEGTNLYYTQARADARVAAGIAAIDYPVDSVNGQTGTVVLSTTNISEGTNQYYTDARADARVTAGIAAINYPVDSVNGQTNTVVLDTDDVAEGTSNLYYTDARADARVSAGIAAINYPVDSVNGQTNTVVLDTDDIGEGTNNLYYTTARWDTRLAAKTTDNLSEGSTNLYFTDARVLSALSGAAFEAATLEFTRWQNPFNTSGYARGYAQWSASGDQALTIANSYSGNDIIPLTISGFSTQSNPLQRWLASSTEVASIEASGQLISQGVQAQNIRIGITASGEIDTTTGNLTIDSAGGTTTIDDDVVIAGNLTVSGTTTTVNTETIALADNIIVLNSNATGAASENAGIEVERGSDTNSALTWDETQDAWYQNRAGTATKIAINTTELSEGTNLYYTDARARSAISATGSITYDSNTGVISYTTPTTDGITEGATNQYFTQSRARTSISATDAGGDGSLSYDNTTGVITYTGPSASEVRAHFSAGTGVTITDGSIAIGQAVATSSTPSFAGLTLTGSLSGDSSGANTLIRTATGTGSNVPLILRRTRTDAARASAGGPWISFEYQGTDNTSATAPQNAIRSQYDSGGRNYLELLELAGSYTTGVQTIARLKRGDYQFKNTTGGNSLLIDDDNVNMLGNYSTSGFANLLFLTKRRSDVTAPTDGDLADFRIGFIGNTGSTVSVAKFEAEYDATNGHAFSMNVYDSTGTTSTATVESTRTETTISAVPTSGVGAPAAVMTLNRDKISHKSALRGTADTGNTVAKGGTYTPGASELNYHELEITNTGSGTGVTIDVTNWTVAGEGGMYAILVYNNSGSAMDITLANNGVTGSTLKNLANGDREMVTVYCVGNYASAELMSAIG